MATKIEPCYVTFEQAKLLKEKGFNVPCVALYCIGYLSMLEDKSIRMNQVFDDSNNPIGIKQRTVGKGQPHLALKETIYPFFDMCTINFSIVVCVSLSQN